MFRSADSRGKFVLYIASALAMLAVPDCAGAAGKKLLYSFSGADGMYPLSSLVADKNGDLFGTTVEGGASGDGMVFELARDGTETVLYSFIARNDGNRPYAGVIADANGDLYGTTYEGGTERVGTVFRLAPDGRETVLHTFAGGNDGAGPSASMIADAAGNLFGTTTNGGGTGCGGNGCGIVFALGPDGTETILHAFGAGRDGAVPKGSLLEDGHGNLFGTTTQGGGKGCGHSGCGTVFEIARTGKEKVLYAFTGGNDGGKPYAELLRDSAGNFYSTAHSGGAYGYGVVFRLAPDGTESVRYAFKGGNDGARPYAGLIAGKAGNLYGTTYSGGANNQGTVFRLASDGTETVLYAFAGGSDGAHPNGLIADSRGNLYGTTLVGGGTGCGGSGCGTVFELRQ